MDGADVTGGTFFIFNCFGWKDTHTHTDTHMHHTGHRHTDQ